MADFLEDCPVCKRTIWKGATCHHGKVPPPDEKPPPLPPPPVPPKKPPTIPPSWKPGKK